MVVYVCITLSFLTYTNLFIISKSQYNILHIPSLPVKGFHICAMILLNWTLGCNVVVSNLESSHTSGDCVYSLHGSGLLQLNPSIHRVKMMASASMKHFALNVDSFGFGVCVASTHIRACDPVGKEPAVDQTETC